MSRDTAFLLLMLGIFMVGGAGVLLAWIGSTGAGFEVLMLASGAGLLVGAANALQGESNTDA